MSATSLAQYGAFLLIVALLVRPVGAYLARVFDGGAHLARSGLWGPLERAIYRLAGVDPKAEMDWKRYVGCFVAFGLGGTLLLYAVLRLNRYRICSIPPTSRGPWPRISR